MPANFAIPLGASLRLIACALATVLMLFASPQTAQAAPLGLVTLLEGEAVLLRDSSKFALSEGLGLNPGDIIDMGAKGRFMLLEFKDGSSLALGPATSVQIAPHLAADRGRLDARVYLLQGWLKVSAAKGRPWAIHSSSFDLSGLTQDAVVLAQGNGGQVFVEAGELSFKPLPSTGAAAAKLSSGEFMGWTAGGKTELAQRPPAAFLQSIPRAFQDQLPSRTALFQGKDLTPKRLGEIAYSDAQAWLNAEPALRKANLSRWKPLARLPEFRKGLMADIKLHPEWEPLLFPALAASMPHAAAYPK
jgi:hypothetical protein